MRWHAVRFWPAQLLIALVRGYRFFVSPALGSSCRFEPSCSAYALGALRHHGALAGTGLTLHRLMRCGPWCAGGHDPVPPPRARRRLSLSGDAAASSPRPTTPPRP